MVVEEIVEVEKCFEFQQARSLHPLVLMPISKQGATAPAGAQSTELRSKQSENTSTSIEVQEEKDFEQTVVDDGPLAFTRTLHFQVDEEYFFLNPGVVALMSLLNFILPFSSKRQF